MWRNTMAAAGIATVTAAATVWVVNPPGLGTDDSDQRPRATARSAALETFGACADLTDWLGRNGAAYVTPWGLDGGSGWGGGIEVVEDMAAGTTGGDGDVAAPAAEAPSTTRAGADVPAFSGTNVQEVGIDEPDTVKTDGQRLLTVREGRLLHVDLTGEAPEIVGTFAIPPGPHGDRPHEADLLLHGDRLLVTWRSWRDEAVIGEPAPVPGAAFSSGRAPGRSVTRLALLDVSADTPRLLETAELDGDLVAGRLHGATARIVVRNQPVLPTVHALDGTEASQRQALERNRDVVRTATAQQWLPWVRVTAHTDGLSTTSERPLVRCEDVHHPGGFAGFGSLDVVTLPLGGSLDELHATSVLTGAETVYASTERLYVTSYRWQEPVPAIGPAPVPPQPREDFRTQVHAFALDDATTTTYLGSGEVAGHVLNQFSLSEHAGHLRIATTVGAPWDGGSESGVHVLALQGGALREVGSVGDLGRGERIYAVRFVGDVGYVVTFRQIDPLYTLDLSDPTAPEVLGELKIPGYSAYLHPVNEDLLIGVGQDASLEGRTRGTQVSLFDVSDLGNPQRVANSTLEQGSSDAEFDHRAFLYWPATGLTVIPVNVWGAALPWNGAMAFEVDAAARSLDRLGTVTHIEHALPGTQAGAGRDVAEPGAPVTEERWVALDRGRITRSLVVGDRLLTLSQAGLLSTTLDTLEVTDWLAFDPA